MVIQYYVYVYIYTNHFTKANEGNYGNSELEWSGYVRLAESKHAKNGLPIHAYPSIAEITKSIVKGSWEAILAS